MACGSVILQACFVFLREQYGIFYRFAMVKQDKRFENDSKAL